MLIGCNRHYRRLRQRQLMFADTRYCKNNSQYTWVANYSGITVTQPHPKITVCIFIVSSGCRRLRPTAAAELLGVVAGYMTGANILAAAAAVIWRMLNALYIKRMLYDAASGPDRMKMPFLERREDLIVIERRRY